MKKLFTTLIVLCVALAGWGAPPTAPKDDLEVDYLNGTLTVEVLRGRLGEQEFNYIAGVLSEKGGTGQVTRIELKGKVNANFDENGKFTEFVTTYCLGNGATTLYLDLSQCEDIVSMVEYTRDGTPDYATKNFRYVYSSDKKKQDVQQGTFWIEDNGNIYVYNEDDDPELNPANWPTETVNNVVKHYSIQLYEMGTPYKGTNNPSGKLYTDDDGNKYYHVFYDSSSGRPAVYNGAYQAAPNNDLPALDIDATSGQYFYTNYYKDENFEQPVTDFNNYDWDAQQQTYVDRYNKSWYRQDGKKLNDNELNRYTINYSNGTGYGDIFFDKERNCEYTGAYPGDDACTINQEGDKYYYYEYVWADGENAGESLGEQDIKNLNHRNGDFNGMEEIKDANGLLIGYKLTEQHGGLTLNIVRHELDLQRMTIEQRQTALYKKTTYLEERKYYLEERKTYVRPETHYYFVEGGKTIFVDDSEVTQKPDGHGYEAEICKGGHKLDFTQLGKYLNGISFPDKAHFTAIPDELCVKQYCPNLQTVVLGSYVEWIGDKAFYAGDGGRNVLKSVSYPGCLDTEEGHVSFPETMKVIGLDAFCGSVNFTKVDLNLPELVRVDAAAFNMVNTEWNELDEVVLPGTAKDPNTNLRFWGNQVFCSSHITSLNMEYLHGIEHFAYDGYNTFGEGTGGGENSTSTETFYYMTDLEELTLPKNLLYAPGGNNENAGMCAECTSLTTVTFTGEPKLNNNCEITNKLIIGENCFRNLPLLGNFQLSDNVSAIYQFAFYLLPSLVRIEIPASMEEIQNYAFNVCNNLTTVIFKEKPKSFGNCNGPETVVRGGDGMGAFYNCHAITDVYVNREQPALHCENYGFDYYITWGHGDAGRALATLHYPKSQTRNYVNLDHYLTDAIVADPGEFHLWLLEHVRQAVVPHKNGWYEFINAGPDITDNNPVQEIILRTFSDYEYSYLVPDGLRAYVVNKVEKINGNCVLTVQRLRVIPKKTGVILYGHPTGKNAQGNPTLTLTPVEFAANNGLPLDRNHWDLLGVTVDKKFKNYLEPTFDEEGKARYIRPFEYDKAGKKVVAWRNFAMNRYSTTRTMKDTRPLIAELDQHNYMGFFRILEDTHAPGHAFLRLTASYNDNGDLLNASDIEYADETGLEIVVKEDPEFFWEYETSNGQYFNARTNPDWNPKKWWEIDVDEHVDYDWQEVTLSWGIRPTSWYTDPNYGQAPIYLGELEDDVDGVKKIVAPAESEDGE